MQEEVQGLKKSATSREAELEAKVAELTDENTRLRMELAALRKRLAPKGSSGMMSTKLSDALRE
jgi:regulator of replication initiation timing